MTSKSERATIKLIKEKHQLKWGTPFPKRCCNYEISDACLGTAQELSSKGVMQWKGRMCKPCLAVRMRELYDERVARREIKLIRGRPLGSKNKPKSGTTKKKSSTSKRG